MFWGEICLAGIFGAVSRTCLLRNQFLVFVRARKQQRNLLNNRYWWAKRKSCVYCVLDTKSCKAGEFNISFSLIFVRDYVMVPINPVSQRSELKKEISSYKTSKHQQYQRKVLLNSFHLNGPTLEFLVKVRITLYSRMK